RFLQPPNKIPNPLSTSHAAAELPEQRNADLHCLACVPKPSISLRTGVSILSLHVTRLAL
ncbi:hypothetical protein, partial [Pseudomonas amygdali]|uniref:hypothetical protein n=1 Tax=Pseudomonas amygdali TaxID=47877 RepID=UPI001EE3FBFA